MPIREMTREHLEGNIALSEQHVAKQEEIIARLTAQGHKGAATQARSVLEVMHDHLRIEREMLANMLAD